MNSPRTIEVSVSPDNMRYLETTLYALGLVKNKEVITNIRVGRTTDGLKLDRGKWISSEVIPVEVTFKKEEEVRKYSA